MVITTPTIQEDVGEPSELRSATRLKTLIAQHAQVLRHNCYDVTTTPCGTLNVTCHVVNEDTLSAHTKNCKYTSFFFGEVSFTIS